MSLCCRQHRLQISTSLPTLLNKPRVMGMEMEMEMEIVTEMVMVMVMVT